MPGQAQLFDGGGLFNRKTDPPRAQTEDEIGVPVPVTGRAEALKGHEVTFEIRAESKTPGATVEFLIRAFPSAGKIVSMVSKPGERNKAIVTYWADPSSSATEDAFSFAVRYRGGRYSSEMRYDIGLTELKTEIQVPAAVDFGQVTVGTEAVQEVIVRNMGGARMDRQIFLAPPWHLVDPADGKLSLDPRGARVLKIAFRPELMGETSYFLSFSRSAAGTTKLVGTGLDPFQVLTDSLELVLDPETGVRSGTIELQNSGTKPIEVEARASTRLQSSMAKSYLLAPGVVTKVQAKLSGTDTAPFDGTVEFFLKNGYAKPVHLVAPVVPGRLELSVPNSLTAEVINFGQVIAGRSMERGLTVTNRGGVAVPFEFEVPPPFRLLTNPGPQLNPLSAVNLSIGLFPAEGQRGPVDVNLQVKGVDQTLSVRLLGNIVAPAGAPPTVVTRTTPAPAPEADATSSRLPAGFRASGSASVTGSPGAPVAPAPPGINDLPAPDETEESNGTVSQPDTPEKAAAPLAPGAISRPTLDDAPMVRIGDAAVPSESGSGTAATDRPAMAPDTIAPPSLDDLPIAPQTSIAATPQPGVDWPEETDPARIEENRSPLGFESAPIIARNLDASLRRPEDLVLLHAGSDSLELAWTAPRGAGPSSYDVEVRGLQVNPGTGEPRSVWAPYPAVKFEKIDRLVKARLSELQPFSQYEMRVVMTTQDGRSAPPSESIVARTEAPMDWTYIYATLCVLLVGLLGYLGWRIYQDRRPEVYQSQYVDL